MKPESHANFVPPPPPPRPPERGVGSEALTGFVDAKRADETGRAEGLPQSLAVSPGLAEALAEYWLKRAHAIIVESDQFNDIDATYGAVRRERAAAMALCAAEFIGEAVMPAGGE